MTLASKRPISDPNGPFTPSPGRKTFGAGRDAVESGRSFDGRRVASTGRFVRFFNARSGVVASATSRPATAITGQEVSAVHQDEPVMVIVTLSLEKPWLVLTTTKAVPGVFGATATISPSLSTV